jgi:hypothetical protein
MEMSIFEALIKQIITKEGLPESVKTPSSGRLN